MLYAGLLSLAIVVILIIVARKAKAQGTSESIYYYHLDHLGTPIMLTDSNQAIAWDATYDPFGKATVTTASVTNNLRFPGQYYDAETGLHYNWYRYYWPEVGRYVQPDSLLHQKSFVSTDQPAFVAILEGVIQNILLDFHPYIYSVNNPLRWIDPWGLWTYATEYGTTGAGLTENITSIEDTVDNIFNDIANRDAIVTYTTNGTHGANSLHYTGNAIDLKIRDLSPIQINQIVNRLRNALGDDYDVILEGDHIHIEYDPTGCN